MSQDNFKVSNLETALGKLTICKDVEPGTSTDK